MTDHAMLHRLLGRPGPDPGCDACFALMDEAAEAQAAGEDLARRFPQVASHVRDCAACREDLAGMRAFLEAPAERP